MTSKLYIYRFDPIVTIRHRGYTNPNPNYFTGVTITECYITIFTITEVTITKSYFSESYIADVIITDFTINY